MATGGARAAGGARAVLERLKGAALLKQCRTHVATLVGPLVALLAALSAAEQRVGLFAALQQRAAPLVALFFAAEPLVALFAALQQRVAPLVALKQRVAPLVAPLVALKQGVALFVAARVAELFVAARIALFIALQQVSEGGCEDGWRPTRRHSRHSSVAAKLRAAKLGTTKLGTTKLRRAKLRCAKLRSTKLCAADLAKLRGRGATPGDAGICARVGLEARRRRP